MYRQRWVVGLSWGDGSSWDGRTRRYHVRMTRVQMRWAHHTLGGGIRTRSVRLRMSVGVPGPRELAPQSRRFMLSCATWTARRARYRPHRGSIFILQDRYQEDTRMPHRGGAVPEARLLPGGNPRPEHHPKESPLTWHARSASTSHARTRLADSRRASAADSVPLEDRSGKKSSRS